MSRCAIDNLRARFGEAIVESGEFRGDEFAVVARAAWRDACAYLAREDGFSMLVDLCGVDYPARPERFEIVAHLRRMRDGRRLRIKTRCPESDASAPSICDIYPAANWFEREAYDLFGIRFDGHPNLKRLLTYEGFEGHPLRKDYPKLKEQPLVPYREDRR